MTELQSERKDPSFYETMSDIAFLNVVGHADKWHHYSDANIKLIRLSQHKRRNQHMALWFLSRWGVFVSHSRSHTQRGIHLGLAAARASRDL